MNSFINRHKNKLTLLSFITIVLGFIFKGFNYSIVSDVFLITATIISGIPIFIKAFQASKNKQFSIELLVVIAVIGALYLAEYVESSVVTFLFMFGAYLEEKTLEKMRNALKKLTQMSPKTALILKDGVEVEVPVNQVSLEDLVIVKTGSFIPVDGVIIKGSATINESSLTGESMPVEKGLDDMAYSGTLVEDGYLVFKALKVGRDTTFNKLIEYIEEAQESKSKTQKFLDKFASFYTPIVVILSIIVYAITMDLHLAITFLVIACPGALVIGAPVSLVAGIAKGARNGILIKGGEIIHQLSVIDTIVLDKTGTLTEGKPSVMNIISYNQSKEETLNIASSLEKYSEHPLGKAIYAKGLADELKLQDNFKDVNIIKGGGIKGLLNDKLVLIGNKRLIENENILIEDNVISDLELEESKGYTAVLVILDSTVIGIISLADDIKEDAKVALASLRKQGIKRMVMLTGDHEIIARQVGEQLMFDEVHASLKPEDKVEQIKRLKSLGYKVLMAGDGLNDAPALATADIGVAMGISGVEVSKEIADVVLTKDELSSLSYSYYLSKKIDSNMKQNIFYALLTVVILLVGVLFNVVNLAIGMFIHEASILIVILNAMRLLYIKNSYNKVK